MKKYYKWPVSLVALGLVGIFFILKNQNSEPTLNDKLSGKEAFNTRSIEQKDDNKTRREDLVSINQGIVEAKTGNKLSSKIGNSNLQSELTPKEIWDAEFQRKKEKRKIGYSKADKPDLFTQYFKDITTRIGDQKSGYKMNYKNVELEKAQQSAKKSLKQAEALNWIQRGPANVGGRTRALIVDPDDNTHNTWFAGAVSGGVWKTMDGGATWQILSEEFTNITTMAMAESNHNIIYAGTGESFPGGTYMVGNGIWKSENRGINWVQLSSTSTNPDFEYINRLIVNPADQNVILAATENGIHKSINGGATWTKVYSSVRGVEDLVADPTNFNILFGGENTIGVLRSINAGNSWAVSNSGMEAGTRFEIAVSPVDHNIVFVSGDVSATESKVYISQDNGITWKRFNDSQNFLGGQGGYDNAIAAHPYIADEVYVGGVDLWKLKFNGSTATSAPLVKNCYPVNTDFLTFVNFSGNYMGGGMSSKEGKNVLPEDWVSVEIRFGPGLTQKAHRFTVPDSATSGVPAANFTYVDYVNVPFQVWDVTNNKQLMVSFRDQEKDGVYNLYKRTAETYGKLGREYIFVNAITYNPAAPSSSITVSGGHLEKALYMFWPNLADGATWDPANLPTSKIVVDYGTVTLYNGAATSVADAYNNYSGPNNYDQNLGLGKAVIPGLHPDHHNITIIPLGNPNFKMVEANDGGLAVSNNNGITITQVPTNYITTQFYGIAKHPTKNEYIGGMQDNGTWRSPSNEDASASSRYLFQISGDGFECLWHATNDKYILGSLYNNSIKRSTNGGTTWTSSIGITAADGPFITRLSVSKENPDLVFAVGKTGVYRSTNFGSSFSKKTIATNWVISSTISSSHHVEVSLSNGNIVWAGGGMAKSSGLQLQVSTDNGLTFKAVDDYSGVAMNTYMSGLATHPTEDSTAYVLFSLSNAPKVLRTRNLGKSWEDITGFGTNKESSNGFPDVIVHSLIVMPHNPDIIWVGTDIGIFESIDNGLSWHIANNGLPAVSVYQMKISGDQVVIATHGRGIWSVTIPELLNAPFISKFVQVEALNLSLTANLNVAYDSVQVYIDNAIDSIVKGTSIGANTIPVVVRSGGTYVAYIIGYIGDIPYKSNTIDITFTNSAFGIDEISNTGKTDLYPNPANSYFRFDLDAKFKKYLVEIYTLNGQKVLSLEKNNSVNNLVNVDFLTNGTYLVNVYFDDRKVTKKLIIKN
jgi:photosystem II stability/assembly factor-like uncharacterized protein